MHSSVLTTIGRTPLVALQRFGAGLPGRLAAKLESRNPLGSVKDRVGLALIEDAERAGTIAPGATLVEPTSGNTGLALAFVCAAKGYQLVLTMPERMSKERIALLRFLGAEVVLTPGSLMRDAVERAEELARERGGVILGQFVNPANPEAHRRTTAEELWEDAGGVIDAFVCGVGTGGTITGVGEVLKARRPGVQIIAVEPARCPVLSGGAAAGHLIQGIGAGFVPAILNRALLDEVVTVTEDDAFATARELARREGLLVGISSGACAWAAREVASRPAMAGKVVVCVLCDSGERYMTTQLFD